MMENKKEQTTMLAKFLEKLGQDTELLAAYKKDPRAVMKEHGVTADEIEAIMSGDEEKRKKVTQALGSMNLLYVHTGDER